MDLSQLTGHIWLDGEMVPWQEARVHVLTHTFHYGLGVFEGVRAYQNLRRHIDFPAQGTYRSLVSVSAYSADGYAL